LREGQQTPQAGCNLRHFAGMLGKVWRRLNTGGSVTPRHFAPKLSQKAPRRGSDSSRSANLW
jgi:hypothetical protein